jgi:hypothetical protein
MRIGPVGESVLVTVSIGKNGSGDVCVRISTRVGVVEGDVDKSSD